MENISPRLRLLVDQSVSLLGEVIRKDWGLHSFERIEKLRQAMAGLRLKSLEESVNVLRRELSQLRDLKPNERKECAIAFTLMLEIMNACENAYRIVSIRERSLPLPKENPDSIIYVLTAHPTEARSPENIWVFHQIQKKLTEVLAKPDPTFSNTEREEILHLITLASKISIVRAKKPIVHDEAEHIYSTLLRRETLKTILKANAEMAPVYLRSWVGGDKDGHPGVDEKAFLDSIQLSRTLLIQFIEESIDEVLVALAKAQEPGTYLLRFRRNLQKISKIKIGDAKRVAAIRGEIRKVASTYKEKMGVAHPALTELYQLARIFPGLVVALEFRESSDLIRTQDRKMPISRMLRALAQISKGGDPRWYVRGLIISMTQTFEDVKLASNLVDQQLQGIRIPVIPLFEQAEALHQSPNIVAQMVEDRDLKEARLKFWSNFLEVMVGYSDSSKESGVLFSRLEIAETMHALDQYCTEKGVIPLFFQGSGGSVDRGGGTIDEQTAWWPSGALRNYKVTIQGEMVERALASPEITWRQLERISSRAGKWKDSNKKHYKASAAVKNFARRVAETYRATVHEDEFLQLIERSTPYPYLNVLKIGSRPSKRTTTISVEGLRAIPWVLCWTQTRVLFPTWWGVGSAWKALDTSTRNHLRNDFKSDPVFSVFVRALGFTLAKIELSVWRLYLENSSLDPDIRERMFDAFKKEHELTLKFYQDVSSTKELLPQRPWLQDSIILRAPMIHPLNLLQILALQENDVDLLRLTVTGVSSGMMNTG